MDPLIPISFVAGAAGTKIAQLMVERGFLSFGRVQLLGKLGVVPHLDDVKVRENCIERCEGSRSFEKGSWLDVPFDVFATLHNSSGRKVTLFDPKFQINMTLEARNDMIGVTPQMTFLTTMADVALTLSPDEHVETQFHGWASFFDNEAFKGRLPIVAGMVFANIYSVCLYLRATRGKKQRAFSSVLY